MPVYNRADSVRRAVLSVVASVSAAGLKHGEVEMVVVDDGSTDASPVIVEAIAAQAAPKMRVTVVRQANAGPSAARNNGVAIARAPHVAFLDSDDLWFDWTVETCLWATKLHPEAPLFFLKPCVFTDHDAPRPDRSLGSRCDVHAGFVDAVINHSRRSFGTNNVIIRRDTFDRLGGFSPDFRCMEDTDLFLRADDQGPCVVLEGDQLFGRQRGRTDNLTGDWGCVVDGFMKMKHKEMTGQYPKASAADDRRLTFLAGSAVRSSLLSFENGQPVLAYRIFFENALIILRGGKGRWLWRVPLIPLLSLVRPQNYCFRLRAPVNPAGSR